MKASRLTNTSLALWLLVAPMSARAAELLSVDTTGTRSANGGVEERFCVSADGRLVAFGSASTNLVQPDTNGLSDVFVRDCELRSNVWSTVQTRSSIPGPGSYPVELTPDGRQLLFVSRATNLVAGATAPLHQLYLHDLPSNQTRLVSVSHDGVQASSGSVVRPAFDARHPRISADGRFVIFASTATDLVAGVDEGTGADIFCRDMGLGVTELITASPTGRALDRGTGNAFMSTNGRFFAFASQATNVVAGLANTNGEAQVYWRDRLAGTNALVSSDLTGGFPAHHANLRSLSRDGRYVCFDALATNIVAGQNDANGTQDLFIRDMVVGETWLVTRATNGSTTGSRVAGAEFSANGEWMLFSATVADLVPGVVDVNGGSPDLFLHHLPTRTNALVSRSLSGQTGADRFVSDGFAVLSSSGRFVLFTTTATNLLAGGTTAVQRLLLRDQLAGRTLDPLRAAPFPTPAYNAARFTVSADERSIFFLTLTNLDSAVVDANQAPDLFRAPLYAPRLLTPLPGHAIPAEALALATYLLQSSTNVLDWVNCATNTAGADGVFTVPDPLPVGPKRFYRLREPDPL
jgi:Tol biopolymer transport system component